MASGRFEKYAMIYAINGSPSICEANPIINDLGYEKIFLKLSIVSESPIPNIIEASTMQIRISMRE